MKWSQTELSIEAECCIVEDKEGVIVDGYKIYMGGCGALKLILSLA